MLDCDADTVELLSFDVLAASSCCELDVLGPGRSVDLVRSIVSFCAVTLGSMGSVPLSIYKS